MNTADNYSKPPTPPPTNSEGPPVLARVPWLATESTPLPSEAAAAELQPALTADFFAPHSVVAMPELGVTSLDERPVLRRVDPPQPLPTVPAETAPPAAAAPPVAEERVLAKATPAKPMPAVPQAKPDTTTYLRFDPPVQAATTAADTSHARSYPVSTPQASAWHRWVASIDHTIRQYHKVIVLAALLTAAGLMMLVVESQQPRSEPAPEGLDPITSSTATQVPPSLLAEAAMGVGDESDAEVAAEPPATTARGPQSDTRHRTAAIEPQESIPLVPLTPDTPESITTLESDTTPIEDEPADWTATARATGEPATVLSYPDTRAPAIHLTQPTEPLPVVVSPPSVASLSGELKSANQQTTK